MSKIELNDDSVVVVIGSGAGGGTEPVHARDHLPPLEQAAECEGEPPAPHRPVFPLHASLVRGDRAPEAVYGQLSGPRREAGPVRGPETIPGLAAHALLIACLKPLFE